MSAQASAGGIDHEVASDGYPVELQWRVEEHLAELRFGVAAGAGRLEEAMRYSLLAGGKRIRPVLALATARAVGRGAGRRRPWPGGRRG